MCLFTIPQTEYPYQTFVHRTVEDVYDMYNVWDYYGPDVAPSMREQPQIGSTLYGANIYPSGYWGSLPHTHDWYMPNLPNGNYFARGAWDSGVKVGSSWAGTGFYADCTNNGVVANTPAISLDAPITVTLNQDFGASISVTPSFHIPTISSYKIEMKRATDSTWHTLYSGSSPTVNTYAKVAGTFHARAGVTINGVTYYSPTRSQTVQFPTGDQIKANTSFIAAATAAWNSIKSYALAHTTTRREEGFWIGFNTATRQTVIYPTITGNPASNGTATTAPPNATLNLGARPADSHSNPTPLDAPTYTVGVFHGHTPFTNVHPTHCRPTGASPEDENYAASWNVAGIVYDYSTSLLCGGHSINLNAVMTSFLPIRRSLP